MRNIDDIKRDLQQAQTDYNAKSSLIRMLEGNTPEHELKSWRDDLRPVELRLKQLRAELAQKEGG